MPVGKDCAIPTSGAGHCILLDFSILDISLCNSRVLLNFSSILHCKSLSCFSSCDAKAMARCVSSWITSSASRATDALRRHFCSQSFSERAVSLHSLSSNSRLEAWNSNCLTMLDKIFSDSLKSTRRSTSLPFSAASIVDSLDIECSAAVQTRRKTICRNLVIKWTHPLSKLSQYRGCCAVHLDTTWDTLRQ